jgi:hypothetical protein
MTTIQVTLVVPDDSKVQMVKMQLQQISITYNAYMKFGTEEEFFGKDGKNPPTTVTG